MSNPTDIARRLRKLVLTRSRSMSDTTARALLEVATEIDAAADWFPPASGSDDGQPSAPPRSLAPMTAKEAAAVLGVDPSRIRQMCRDGQLDATRAGRDWAIYLDQEPHR